MGASHDTLPEFSLPPRVPASATYGFSPSFRVQFFAHTGWNCLGLLPYTHPLRGELMIPISQVKKLRTATCQDN